MAAKIKVGGVWKNMSDISIKTADGWKPIDNAWSKVNGTWVPWVTFVPVLTGRSFVSATADLTRRGLVSTFSQSDTSDSQFSGYDQGFVWQQGVAARQQVERGSSVNLYTYRYVVAPTPTPTPTPSPTQDSSVSGISPASGSTAGGYSVTVSGYFPSALSNISVAGNNIAYNSWSKTSNSVTFTMPAGTAGTTGVQLWNGKIPLMQELSFTYTSSGGGGGTPTPTPEVTTYYCSGLNVTYGQYRYTDNYNATDEQCDFYKRVCTPGSYPPYPSSVCTSTPTPTPDTCADPTSCVVFQDVGPTYQRDCANGCGSETWCRTGAFCADYKLSGDCICTPTPQPTCSYQYSYREYRSSCCGTVDIYQYSCYPYNEQIGSNGSCSNGGCAPAPTPTPTPTYGPPNYGWSCSASDYANLPAPQCMSIGACDIAGSVWPTPGC